MIDKIDQKILLELLKNSRISISLLSKKLKISRDVANYRINKMIENQIIRNFITEIDLEKLGFCSAFFCLNIKPEIEKEFIEYIESLNFTSWSGTLSGFWSIGMAIYGKNLNEVEKNFQTIFEKYHKYIINHRFEFYKSNHFFYEKYFGSNTEIIKTKETKYILDNYDKIILNLLAKNSKISSVEISKKVPITAVAIANRIKNLEKNNYILKYSIYINVFKLELFQYYFFIKNNNLSDRKKIYQFLTAHKKVCSYLDYIGDPFIEFGIFVKNPYEIRDIIKELRQNFPQSEIIDFFMSQEDLISYGLPKCVFD